MKIMSVDFGDARTGLAICDPTEFLASPVGVIKEKRFDFIVEKVANALKEKGAQAAVVGLPLNMDGSFGFRAEHVKEFAEKLRLIVDIPIRMWDERQTTVSAAGFLNETDTRGKKRKEVIDAVSAVIILDSYLQWRKNHPGEF